MKKIVLSKENLDKNAGQIEKFLTKKGMSTLKGGSTWGNSNYAESTYVRRIIPELDSK